MRISLRSDQAETIVECLKFAHDAAYAGSGSNDIDGLARRICRQRVGEIIAYLEGLTA